MVPLDHGAIGERPHDGITTGDCRRALRPSGYLLQRWGVLEHCVDIDGIAVVPHDLGAHERGVGWLLGAVDGWVQLDRAGPEPCLYLPLQDLAELDPLGPIHRPRQLEDVTCVRVFRGVARRCVAETGVRPEPHAQLGEAWGVLPSRSNARNRRGRDPSRHR